MKKTIFIIILILAVAALVYWQFGEKIIKNASAPSETPGESLSPSPSLNPTNTSHLRQKIVPRYVKIYAAMEPAKG